MSFPNESKGINWDKIPLGTKSDASLAKETGVNVGSVRSARLKRGISPWGTHMKVDWSKEPLGKFPDRALALKLGVHHVTVHEARKRRGIPKANVKFITTEGEPANFPEALIDLYWHKKEISHKFQVRLGKFVADWVINCDTIVEYAGFGDHRHYGKEYARKLSKKMSYYQDLEYKVLIITPPELHIYNLGELPTPRNDTVLTRVLLSKKTDLEVAKKLGYSKRYTRKLRRKMGVPSDTERKEPDWEKVGLGEKPDNHIAKELGISVYKVRGRRALLGIGPYRRKPDSKSQGTQ